VVVGAAAAMAPVVVGPSVVETAVVVAAAKEAVVKEIVAAGPTVSVLLVQAVSRRQATATAYFLTASVCHPSPEGVVGVSDALGVDTYSRSVTE